MSKHRKAFSVHGGLHPGGWVGKKRKQQTKGALTVAKGLGHHSKVVFDLLCDESRKRCWSTKTGNPRKREWSAGRIHRAARPYSAVEIESLGDSAINGRLESFV